MARFKVTAPDGKSYAIEAPDADTAAREADAAFASLKAKPELSAGETAADALISAGSGVAKGTMDLVQAPADLATFGAWGARKLGYSEDAINNVKNSAIGSLLKPSQALREYRKKDTTLNRYAGYKPESTVGKYAKTIGEFAPGAAGGQAGLGMRALKYAIAPGVASEGLGQLADQYMPSAAPYARAVGGLAGMGAASFLNPVSEIRAVNRMPSRDQFNQAASASYDELNRSGVYIKNQAMKDMFAGLETHLLKDAGYVPGKQTKARDELLKIQAEITGQSSAKSFDKLGQHFVPDPNRAPQGPSLQHNFGDKPLTFKEAADITERIGGTIKNLPGEDRDNRRILWAAKHYLDDRLRNLPDSAAYMTKTGNPQDLANAKAALANARRMYTQKSKAELLDQMTDNAEHTGKALYTRAGVEHGTRKEFLKFLRKNPNKRQSLNANELDSFETVADGTWGGNRLRDLGKLSNSTPSALSTFGTVGGLVGLGSMNPVLGALAGGVAVGGGHLAKYLSKRSTMKNVANAQSMIRTGRRMLTPWKSKFGTAVTINQAATQ
jgi:hypothetical protein